MQPTYRPRLEPLETRDLLAGVTAYVLNNNLLVVSGTTGNDYIAVTQADGKLSVYGSQIAVGSRKVASVDASTISRVVINGYSGADIIIASTLTEDAIISGGNGNDSVYSGAGNDILDGGAGDDLLYGAAGNDRITSGVSTSEHDNVLGGSGFNWYWRPFNAANPFVNGQQVSDIVQGEAPLCQTTAAMAEAVQQQHNFASDIRYQGNGAYEVKLRGNASTQKVKFDGWTNSSDPVMTNGEFWTILEQRARLQSLGIDPATPRSTSDWNAANLKTNGRLYSIGEALYAFTGRVSTYNYINSATPQALRDSLGRGDYLVAQSRSASGTSSDGIIGNHAYAILAVYYDAGVWKVRLYNPWGKDRDNGGTIDSLDRSKPAANDGFITLSWSQFTNSNNFKGYFAARR
jgi:hypothetical protein